MRTLALGAALVLGCHGSTSSPVPASPADPAASSAGSATAHAGGSAPGSGSGSASAAAGAHPMPAAMAAKLAVYGAPHGTPIYVPPAFKDPEHWIAFVGGDRAAQSAWLVTPADPKQQVEEIGGWPTALHVDGALVEAVTRDLPTSDHASVAWILATSTAGMGQPAGLHAVVRVEIEGAGVGDDVSTNDNTLVALAGVTTVADLDARLGPVATEYTRTMDAMSDDADTKLAATLGDAKSADADLAALIPPGGVRVADAWQKLFVRPRTTVKTPAELRALIADRGWHCSYTSCSGGDKIALLGLEGAHVVVRDLLLAPAAPATPGGRRSIEPSRSTAISERTLKELGRLDAKVVAEAPYGVHGTLGVATGAGGGVLFVRDGDYVALGQAEIRDDVTAARLRFLDVDGDGTTDVAIATSQPANFDESTLPEETVYHFATVEGMGNDIPAGLAAIGAKDVDDAVARALALPDRPVTVEQACALLGKIKTARSLTKAGPHARVMGFIEPFEPEVGHGDLDAKEGAAGIHDVVHPKCELSCDSSRPECGYITDGPEADYFLFHWNGDQLELALAMLYRGA